jgi:hypothetical protein
VVILFPQILCFDVAGVVGIVVDPDVVLSKALIDVLFLPAFCLSGSVRVPCVLLLASESAFLFRTDDLASFSLFL